MPVDPQTELLLEKSAEDRAGLEFALPSSLFGFHAQQAVEKLLKALIAARGAAYPFTHELSILAYQLQALGETYPSERWNLLDLQSFAVLMRYDASIELSEDDRENIRSCVDTLRSHVVARVGELST